MLRDEISGFSSSYCSNKAELGLIWKGLYLAAKETIFLSGIVANQKLSICFLYEVNMSVLCLQFVSPAPIRK